MGVLAASTLRARKVAPAPPPPPSPVPSSSTWTETGLRELQSQGFAMVGVVPTESFNVAEFSLRGTSGVELGSIVYWNKARATIAWHGKQYVKYAQQLEGVPSEYAGKVGGTSDRSIVVHDEKGNVAAEIDALRGEGLEFCYTISSGGAAYAVAVPAPFAPLDRALHTVLKFGETVAAYQANKVGDFSEYVALKDDLPDSACVAVFVCSLLR